MNTYEEIEYSNVTLQLDQKSIHRLIEYLVEVGLPVAWKETQRFFTLSIQTTWTTQRLIFDKQGKRYRLRNRNYNVKDQRFSEVLQKFICEVKGHAVKKKLHQGQLVVENIRYGEPIQIVEIVGPNKKILFEKDCSVNMHDVMEAFRRTDAEERIPELKMEIDQQLELLLKAIEKKEANEIIKIKDELENMRMEMVMLEA